MRLFKNLAAGESATGAPRDRSRMAGLTLLMVVVLPLLCLWLVGRKTILATGQLPGNDAREIAQLARNLAGSKGYTTNVVYPRALVKAPKIENAPDVKHPPMFPTAERIAFVTGVSETRAAGTSAVFFILTIPVLYLLARGMFNQNAALLAVFAFTVSLAYVSSGWSGLPVTMAAFLTTWFFYACFRYAQEAVPEDEDSLVSSKSVIKWAAASGLLLAAGYLTDYPLFWIVFPAAFFIYRNGGANRRAGLVAFLVAFAIPAGLWMLRNHSLTGHALYGIRALEVGMGTPNHPLGSLYQSTSGAASALEFFREDKISFLKKFINAYTTLYTYIPSMGQVWLAPFFIAGLFYSFRRVGVNPIRRLLLWALVFVTFGFFGLINGPVSLLSFGPIVLAFGAAFFVRLLTDARLPAFYSRMVSVAAVALLALPFVVSVFMAKPQQVVKYELEEDLQKRVEKGVPVVTDRPVEMAWYGGKVAILPPSRQEDFEFIDKIKPVKVIALTRASAGSPGWSGECFKQVVQLTSQGKEASTDLGKSGFRAYREMPARLAEGYLRSGVVVWAREGGLQKSEEAM